MPKEITHWLICLKAAEELKDTPLGRGALQNPAALQVGALFPDILYHLPARPASAPYRAIASALHGSGGEDTYELLRRIMAFLSESPYGGQCLAFLLGVASHLQADMVFHPLVYYLTGDYEDPDPVRRSRAVCRHRRFESLMDIFFSGGIGQVRRYTWDAILERLELTLGHLLDISLPAGGNGAALPDLKVQTTAALHNMQRLQHWYQRPVIAGLLYLAAPLFPRPFRELAALFYSPQLVRFIPRISGTLQYKNPLTGVVHSAALASLFDRAVEQSAALGRRLDETILSKGAKPFADRGPSLSWGVSLEGHDRARYFAQEPFFDFA